MFTGIVEELGQVLDIKILSASAELTIRGKKVLEGTNIGDSIAVNGTCLTVVKMEDSRFTVDMMAETLQKTSLSELSRGSYVNLERALQLQSRLGGHLVSGHVDGTGKIKNKTQVGIAQVVEIAAFGEIIEMLLPKGSVAIDGISLTIVEVKKDSFTISLIPHTVKETTLGFKDIGAKVNLETDIIGKYVANFLKNQHQDRQGKRNQGNLSLQFLTEKGFL